ncbi:MULTISPECIES: hypothetical protein [unclassified Streptomyces]|uniref:hypothetical protein n=1 Tax=unclassified Streptomyces TaxID=2593676 RepID=UPI0036E3537E
MRTEAAPQQPPPELWLVLEEAARDCAPTVFPRDRIRRRATLVKRRRRLLTGTLAVALLAPLTGRLVLPSGPDHSHTGTQPPTSASPESAHGRSPVRVVRPGERVEAGLGVWYTLEERAYCDANPDEQKPTCERELDVEQSAAAPMTFHAHRRSRGVVYVLAYTGRTPAARITKTEHDRTTDLPIVRLAGRPAYVSTHAVGAPRPDDTDENPLGDCVFRVYDADGKELARTGGR